MSQTFPRKCQFMSSKENVPPDKHAEQSSRISAMKELWEQHYSPAKRTDSVSTVRTRDSPVLSQLMNQSENHPEIISKTSCVGTTVLASRRVLASQRELARKHHKAKSRLEGLSGLAGGVSLWPAMDDMRLSVDDMKSLVVMCGILIAATVAIFFGCHGSHIIKLKTHSALLDQFHSNHDFKSIFSQDVFEKQLLTWHRKFMALQDDIHHDFDTVWSKSSVFEILFIISYITGIGVLLYFLVKNMFSKQRLTPRAIKVWISLLCVITIWTVLSMYLLACAQQVEIATQRVVHQLNNELAFLVQSPWDLTKYHSVLVYWRTRCLPPTTGGVLSIMGLVAVQDVSYYLQYYSLPVLTALCTPIVTIVMSLRKVYARKS